MFSQYLIEIYTRNMPGGHLKWQMTQYL